MFVHLNMRTGSKWYKTEPTITKNKTKNINNLNQNTTRPMRHLLAWLTTGCWRFDFHVVRSYRWTEHLRGTVKSSILFTCAPSVPWDPKAESCGSRSRGQKKHLLRLVLVSMNAWEYLYQVDHQGTVGTKTASTIVVLALSWCRSK